MLPAFTATVTSFSLLSRICAGDLEEARRILKSYEESIPGLAMVRLRRVSLERRHGNLEAAEALLQEAIRDNEGMPLASFYAIKLARQVLKVQKNLIKARKVLMEALEKDPVRFWEGEGDAPKKTMH